MSHRVAQVPKTFAQFSGHRNVARSDVFDTRTCIARKIHENDRYRARCRYADTIIRIINRCVYTTW